MPRALFAVAIILGPGACGRARPPTLPGPASAPAAAVAGPGGTQLPALFSRQHIFLRATIAGVPALLLFDSGASATILSPRLVRSLGLAYQGPHIAYGIGEPVMGASAYEGPEIQIGAVQIRPARILSWPGARFPGYGPTVPDGVIGYDLLRAFVVLVDMLGGRVVAYDTAAAPRTGRGAQTVALRVVSGLPVIEAEVFSSDASTFVAGPPASIAVVVDFGAGAGLQLSRGASDRLAFPTRLRDRRQRQLIGIGGSIELSEGLTDSVRIAGGSIPNAVVAADTTETSSVALAQAEGLVGTEVLRRFTVTLDYPRRRAVFAPNALLRAPFCRNAAGICVRTETSLRAAQVVFVDPGSIAARAGIRPGFVILAIDGASVARLSADEIDRLLERGPGQLLEVARNFTHVRELMRPGISQRGGRRAHPPLRDPVGEVIRLPAQ